MKSTIISMSIVLVVLMIIPFFLFDGGELANKFGFGGGNVTDSIEDLKAKAPKNVQTVTTDKKVEIYKWVDEYGVMQFSQVPPFEGGDSEIMVLAPNTNIIDAIKIPEKKEEVASQPKVFRLGNPYTPGGASEMIDQFSEMQEQLSQQQAEQEKMLQDMFKQK